MRRGRHQLYVQGARLSNWLPSIIAIQWLQLDESYNPIGLLGIDSLTFYFHLKGLFTAANEFARKSLRDSTFTKELAS